MGNVMVIPAKRQVGNNIKKAEKPKLRVAAYCRVSTDSDEQATRYDAQIEQVVIEAINRVLCQKDDFLQKLRANIATVVLRGDALSPEVIDERMHKLQKELLKKVNQKDDYDAIAAEILRLRDQRRQAEVDSVIKDEQMKQIRELQDFVK